MVDFHGYRLRRHLPSKGGKHRPHSAARQFSKLFCRSMGVGRFNTERFDTEEYRRRLRKMTEAELLKHGKAARAMANDRIHCLYSDSAQ